MCVRTYPAREISFVILFALEKREREREGEERILFSGLASYTYCLAQLGQKKKEISSSRSNSGSSRSGGEGRSWGKWILLVFLKTIGARARSSAISLAYVSFSSSSSTSQGFFLVQSLYYQELVSSLPSYNVERTSSQ